MAQHDYVIDNSTGANVRADLNNALQAIVTNNSGSSAPSATFPFMLFADSSAGTMKIRNAADNAFIELFQLDGTFTLEDGSASTPALAFRDDLNTGIFSSAADTFNVATNGVERLELGTTTIFNEDGADVDFRIEGDTDVNLFYADAGNNRIGLGIASPTSKLYVNTVSTEHVITARTADSNGNCIINILSEGTTGNSRILFSDTAANDGIISYSHNDRALFFGTAGTSENMRIDSSGRLLLGNTTGGSMNAAADNLVVGSGIGHNGMTIFSAADADGWIVFNDAANTTLTGAINYNHVNNNFAFYTNAAERMRIDSSGNVGIGSSSPTEKLEINLGTDKIVQFTGGIGQIGNVAGMFAVNTAKTEIDDFGIMGKTLKFASGTAASGAERFRITTSGNFLINCTDLPSSSVAGAGFERRATGRAILNSASNVTTASNHIVLINPNGTVGTVTTNGSATSYNTSSDYRLKENATAISDGITRLKTLKPYRFNFKSDATTTVDGFFAHEVTAVPEAVTGTKDEVDADNKPVYQGIDQSKLVPLLVAAVQELIGKVEALEAA